MTPPVQVPVEADSSWPTLAVPEIAGLAVLTGADFEVVDTSKLRP